MDVTDMVGRGAEPRSGSQERGSSIPSKSQPARRRREKEREPVGPYRGIAMEDGVVGGNELNCLVSSVFRFASVSLDRRRASCRPTSQISIQDTQTEPTHDGASKDESNLRSERRSRYQSVPEQVKKKKKGTNREIAIEFRRARENRAS